MSAIQRLALRALGAPSQVRPRLGGLFERDTAGEGGNAGDPYGSAQVSVLRLRDQVVATPVRGEPPAATPAPAPRAGEIAAVQVPPRLDTSSGPLESSAFTAPLARTTADSTAPSSPQNASPAGEDPQGTEPARPVFAPLIERTIREATRADHGEAPATPPAGPPPYRPLLPERRERPTPAAPLGLRPEPAAAGPADIQISIGRIEVRGEPERQRPSPAPRRGPQLMSLEDYLARGRRR